MLKFLSFIFAFFALTNSFARISTGDSFGEKIFINEKNEQVILRGMNVSGSVKLANTHFRPFLSKEDATEAFKILKNNLGANVVRLTVSWEGIQPVPKALDPQYLADIVAYIEASANQNIYVLIDFHQDLFSRHIFSEEQKYKGNGAPFWATPDLNDAGKCGKLCFHWAQNNLTNKTVKEAYRQFFNNEEIESEYLGKPFIFKMQDTYIDMLSTFVGALKNNLSKQSWDYVLGVDPFNEPVDGGMEGLTPEEWDQQKLWPFYLNVERSLVQKNCGELLIFAEPLVFWNNNVGLTSPRTGTGYYNGTLSKRFVFNSHYYDGKRQGPFIFRSVKSGDYLNEFDAIRNESKRLKVPAFVSEFGAPLHTKGKRSPLPILRGIYLGLDLSTPKELDMNDTQDRVKIKEEVRANFYSSPLSYTQWHFDFYYNQSPLPFDGWNKENFSVVKNKNGEYNLPTELLERIQILSTPSRIYHSLSSSGNLGNAEKNWLALFNQETNTVDMKGKSFFYVALTAAKGEHKIFIPKSFGPYILITSKYILKEASYGQISIMAQDQDDFILIAKQNDLTDEKNWQKGLNSLLYKKESPVVILPN